MLAASQVTGVLVINNYGPELYASMGFNPFQQQLLSAGSLTTSIVGNFVGMLLVDRWGRVRFMILGALACTVALALEAALIAVTGNSENLGAHHSSYANRTRRLPELPQAPSERRRSVRQTL